MPIQEKPPLDGVRVLDIGHYIAGPLAGMLLADQGAEVIKIVPPAGLGIDDTLAKIINRGKHMRPMNLKDTSAAEDIFKLISGSDILIENFSPGVLERLGLSKEDLNRLNPNLIVLSLPGFEQGDTLGEGVKAYEGIVAAATGQYTDIHAIRDLFGLDPVYTALPMASIYAGVHGAASAVLALRERYLNGGAAHITAPLANAALSAMSSIFLDIEKQPDRYVTPRLPSAIKKFALPFMRRWAKTGARAQEKLLDIARKSYPALMTSYPCRDGELLYLFAIDNPKLVKRVLSVLNLQEEALSSGLVFENPYMAGDLRNNLSESSNLASNFQAMLKGKIGSVLVTDDAIHWEQRLSAVGVPCSVQRTTQEWMQLPELFDAGIVTSFEDETGQILLQPGLQAWVSDAPPHLARPQRSKYVSTLSARGKIDSFAPLTEARAPGKWLSGLTVIDMCSMVAGPVAGRTLAEYGARVIKIETPRANHGPRMTCWYGIDGNPGKESILLDLSTPDGHEAMRTLLVKADILVTNHMPDAMAGLGLSEDDVRGINPNIVLTRIGTYNGPLGGPWQSRNGYDPVLQAASGIMERYGDPGFPELHAIASCVDALTGYSAAFGTALALFRNIEAPSARTVDTSLAAAATLIQLPFAHNREPSPLDVGGQTALGTDPFYQLYRARDGWLFLAAPGASIRLLPKHLLPRTKLVGTELSQHLQSIVVKLTLSKTLRLLKDVGLSAVPVNRVEDLSMILRTRPKGASLRLVQREMEELGLVTSVPPNQVFTNGSLSNLAPAQKLGASTKSILNEFDLSTQRLLNNGTAGEVNNEYLPS